MEEGTTCLSGGDFIKDCTVNPKTLSWIWNRLNLKPYSDPNRQE